MEKNNINKPNFDRYIEELYKINTEDKKRAEKIAKSGLRELCIVFEEDNPPSSVVDSKNKKIIIAICILIALCGLLVQNIGMILMYIFGLVFFFAGLFVGSYVIGFGLIFLFSHGGSGLFIMISSLLSNEFFDFEDISNNPVFTDGGIPNDLKQYLIGIIAVFAIAIIYTIAHNLSSKLKEDNKHIIIILSLYLIGILLVGLAPRIFPYLIAS